MALVLLTPEQAASLRDWFLPEKPSPQISLHILNTGNGAIFADRWPRPRSLLAATASNYKLLGDARALSPYELRPHVRGFVDASAEMADLLIAAFPDAKPWPRVILTPQSDAEKEAGRETAVRRLSRQDVHHIWGLSPDVAWISVTWGGPAGLAASGYAWGAFADGRLASVACTFLVGQTLEEIGVVTEPAHRGLGLSTACAAALCSDVSARGRRPNWTTSPDNAASLRVAMKLGFVEHGRNTEYVVGVPIPQPILDNRNG